MRDINRNRGRGRVDRRRLFPLPFFGGQGQGQGIQGPASPSPRLPPLPPLLPPGVGIFAPVPPGLFPYLPFHPAIVQGLVTPLQQYHPFLLGGNPSIVATPTPPHPNGLGIYAAAPGPIRPTPPLTSTISSPSGGQTGQGEGQPHLLSGDQLFYPERPIEVKELTWSIKDFPASLALEPGFLAKVEFDAGHQIGLPCTWRMELFLSHLSPNYIVKICLPNQTWPGNEFQDFLARYDIALKTWNDPEMKKVTIHVNHPHRIGRFRKAQGRILMTLEELRTRGALLDDILTLRLKFIVYGDQNRNHLAETGWMNEMIDRFFERTSRGLRNLLETGHNSDFLIKVRPFGDEGEWFEMKVHSSVLKAKSLVFAAMLESDMKERNTGILEITDFEPDCVKIMVEWMYTGVLDKYWMEIPHEIMSAADKYGVGLLLNFLDNNLHHACNPKNVITLGKVARLYGLTTATKNIVKYIAANAAKLLD